MMYLIKNDVFNLDKGMEIIKKRMLMKILDVEYKEFISKMMNSLR